MSELLKLSLALEDTQLKRRVLAALIKRVNTLKHRDDDLGLFARLVLAEPKSRKWDDFMFAVVVNSDVLDATALSPDNSQVFVTNVSDDQITGIINQEVSRTHKDYLPNRGNDDGQDES